MEEFNRLIKLAEKKGASDVHAVVGAVPYFRIDTKLIPVKKPIITQSWILKITRNLLNQSQASKLDEIGSVDIGKSLGSVHLRINVHKQTAGIAMSIRLLPNLIPTPEELFVPQNIMDIADLEEGFVILTGATGSGKSTTLAMLLDRINKNKARHIISLEDPIEYRFKNQKSLIEQRQLGVDFDSFPTALRSVLRQDPDVIVVGEMRDPETIALALTAAETGHLVLSTLHAPNAPEAVERIVNVFEGISQQQILIQLASTLRVVVAQKLIPRVDHGLVGAYEILVSNRAIQNAIRQNDLGTIRSAIQTGKRSGMISMDQYIKQLQKEGIIN